MANKVNARSLALVLVPILAVLGGGYAYLRHQWTPPPAPPVPVVVPRPVVRPRPWRWPTENHWVVHQVVQHIAAWSKWAAEPATPPGTLLVSQAQDRLEPDAFVAQLKVGADETEIKILPGDHIWDPAAYTAAARMLLGDRPPQEATEAKGLDPLLLSSDTASLRKADSILLAALTSAPRSAALHEQAALLWAAHALREEQGHEADERAFLNGITAHLALARALRGDAPLSWPGRIAGVVLDSALGRQVEAIQTLDASSGAAEAEPQARWALALRMHVTDDPRLHQRTRGATRLETIEAVRALDSSQGCRAAVDRARAWGLKPAADWVRATVGNCNEPEKGELTAINPGLQFEDAARLIDSPARAAGDVLTALAEAAAVPNQAAPPTAVVPRSVRAEAGQRHLAGLVEHEMAYLKRFDQPQEMKMLELTSDALVKALPQRPFLEMWFESVARRRPETGKWIPRAEYCERAARLVAERPDLVGRSSWGQVARCRLQGLLNMVQSDDWDREISPRGTALIERGPWRRGRKLDHAVLEEAARRAPWWPGLAERALMSRHRGDPPAEEVKRAYGALLDYNLPAMSATIPRLFLPENDDEVRRLGDRTCEIDVEYCGWAAEALADRGRSDLAEPLWKKALAGSQDRISLSSYLRGYVMLLLERGETREALRVAKVAADVYSGSGLATLAIAYERLGRFDEAVRIHQQITERYDDKLSENRFYIRHQQRYPDGRYAPQAEAARAELFPKGLVRRSLEDFRRDGHRGGVPIDLRELTVGLRRAGIRNEDFLVAIDGFAVESKDQLWVVNTFTDEPRLSAIVMRSGTGERFIEVSGPYIRDQYGPVLKP